MKIEIKDPAAVMTQTQNSIHSFLEPSNKRGQQSGRRHGRGFWEMKCPKHWYFCLQEGHWHLDFPKATKYDRKKKEQTARKQSSVSMVNMDDLGSFDPEVAMTIRSRKFMGPSSSSDIPIPDWPNHEKVQKKTISWLNEVESLHISGLPPSFVPF